MILCMYMYIDLFHTFNSQELSSKTKELLVNISSLAPNGGKITLDLLRARKLTPATENFLFSLAAAEGLVQM